MLLMLQKQGKKIEALENRPKPDIVVEWYISAYKTLTKNKEVGSAVSMTDMKSYCDMFDIIGTIKEFVEIIQAIDEVILKYQRDRLKAEANNGRKRT